MESGIVVLLTGAILWGVGGPWVAGGFFLGVFVRSIDISDRFELRLSRPSNQCVLVGGPLDGSDATITGAPPVIPLPADVLERLDTEGWGEFDVEVKYVFSHRDVTGLLVYRCEGDERPWVYPNGE